MPSSSMHYTVQAQISLIGLLLGFRVYVPNRDKDHVVSELGKLIEKHQLEHINAQDLGSMNQLINLSAMKFLLMLVNTIDLMSYKK